MTLSPPHVVVGAAKSAIPRSRYPARSRDDPSFEGSSYDGRDAVRVEDRVDVAQRGQQRAQRLHVADLGHVPVLRELVLDVAAVLDDVRAVLGERAGDVLEQARPVPGVDRDLDAEALRRAAVPLDLREPLRVALQRLDVRAVVAVDRDALAERDVADDLVARAPACSTSRAGRARRRRRATMMPKLSLGDGVARLRRLERDGLFLGDLLGLQALDHLVDDLRRLELPRAEREVEVLGLLEARSRGSPARAAAEPASFRYGQVLLLQRLLERLAALLLGLLARLAREPLADLVPRARRLRERQPVARRAAARSSTVRISTKSPLFSR